MSSSFQRELVALLNIHSQEKYSNTPDYILAGYLIDCFAAFNRAVISREGWYGRVSAPLSRATGPKAEIRSGIFTDGTAAEHFRNCGPFCKHVVLCRDCSNIHGLCNAHDGSPDGAFSWAKPAANDGDPGMLSDE